MWMVTARPRDESGVSPHVLGVNYSIHCSAVGVGAAIHSLQTSYTQIIE